MNISVRFAIRQLGKETQEHWCKY